MGKTQYFKRPGTKSNMQDFKAQANACALSFLMPCTLSLASSLVPCTLCLVSSLVPYLLDLYSLTSQVIRVPNKAMSAIDQRRLKDSAIKPTVGGTIKNPK